MLPLLIFITCALVYTYFTRGNNYWNKIGIPFQKPTFFFGNFAGVLFGLEHFGILLEKIYKKYDDLPYVGIFRLTEPMLLIRDPEIIQRLLVNDYHTFPLPNFQVDPDIDPIMACNPFAQVGDEWKINRGRWAAVVTPSKLKYAYRNMIQRSNVLIGFLRKNTNLPTDAYDMSSTFFVDIIVSSIFGVKINTSELDENPFIKITQTLFRPNFWDSLKTFTFMTAPFLQKMFNVTMVSEETRRILLDITKEIFLNSEESIFIRKEDSDKFRKILECNKIESHRDFELPAMVFGFLQDGAQTSSIVMSFALFELAVNPEIQKRLRNEINKNIDDSGDIPYETLMQMPYLDMILSEVLRLYPPGLSLARKSIKPYNIKAVNGISDVTLPTGTVTIVPVYALHMDPKHFPDPERFEPERFTEKNIAARHKFVYLPFGKGPRSCFGNRLATLMAKMGVVTIVRNFEIRVNSKTQNKPLKVNPNSLIHRPVGGIWLTFHLINEIFSK